MERDANWASIFDTIFLKVMNISLGHSITDTYFKVE
jgi:hypothetical protein